MTAVGIDMGKANLNVAEDDRPGATRHPNSRAEIDKPVKWPLKDVAAVGKRRTLIVDCPWRVLAAMRSSNARDIGAYPGLRGPSGAHRFSRPARNAGEWRRMMAVSASLARCDRIVHLLPAVSLPFCVTAPCGRRLPGAAMPGYRTIHFTTPSTMVSA